VSPKTTRNYELRRISPKADAEVLIAALDSVFRSKYRTKMFANRAGEDAAGSRGRDASAGHAGGYGFAGEGVFA
jgi:hypothetical protein